MAEAPRGCGELDASVEGRAKPSAQTIQYCGERSVRRWRAAARGEGVRRGWYSIKQTKFALSNYNEKRYWLNDCESLPYGHYIIDDDIALSQR